MSEKEKVETTAEATETEAEVTTQQPEAETETGKANDVEAMEAALKKANREAAKFRKELETYQKAEQERKEAEMSELEKAQAKIEELQQKALKAEETAKMQAFKAEVAKVSASLGFADPDDAIKMLDAETELDGIEDALKELAEAKPYLLKSENKTKTNIRPTNSGTPQSGETPEERRTRLLG